MAWDWSRAANVVVSGLGFGATAALAERGLHPTVESWSGPLVLGGLTALVAMGQHLRASPAAPRTPPPLDG